MGSDGKPAGEDLLRKWVLLQCRADSADALAMMSRSARRRAFNAFLAKGKRADLIGRLHCV